MSLDILLDNIYIISLDRDYQTKYLTTSKYLVKEGLVPRRFKAVDGGKMSFMERWKNSDLMSSLFCPTSAFGCASSHFQLWKMIVKQKLPVVLVLEDDVRPVRNFKTQLQRVYPYIPKDWDLVYLGCHGGCHKDPNPFFRLLGRKHIRINKHVLVPEYPGGTYAYMITLNGAKKLIKELEYPYWHIDHSIAFNLPKFKIYTTTKKLFSPCTDISSTNGPLKSHILNEFLTYRVTESDPPVSWYFNEDCLRIPLLNINISAHILVVFLVISLVYVKFSLGKAEAVVLFLLYVLLNNTWADQSIEIKLFKILTKYAILLIMILYGVDYFWSKK